MFHKRDASSGAREWGNRSCMILPIVLLTLAAGCSSVVVGLEQPVGAKVELYEKGKWFGSFGPDWGTGWNKVLLRSVEAGDPCEVELEAEADWLDSAFTWWPRQYRAKFDLSNIVVYPTTPTSVVEVRYAKEAVPEKYQHILYLWQQNRTPEVLMNLPIDVLANVLYHLGDVFKDDILAGVSAEQQQAAGERLKAMLESPTEPSPKEVEAWLKSFLSAEQFGKLCYYVRHGVRWSDEKWVSVLGDPKPKGIPVFWKVLFGVLDLFVRQAEVWRMDVDFYRLIVRDLMVRTTESKLVNLGTLKFYAEVYTCGTSDYTALAVPAIDLVQDVGLADIIRPTIEQEAELQRFGMTRNVRLDPKARAEAIRSGLPPAGLQTIPVTAMHSQILGALLEGETAILIIWNNPVTTDPERYLTTLVTVDPQGLGRVWVLKRDRVLAARSGDNAQPMKMAKDESYSIFKSVLHVGTFGSGGSFAGAYQPLIEWLKSEFKQTQELVMLTGELVGYPGVVSDPEGSVSVPDPIAVIKFGRRRREPWKDMAQEPVSYVKPMKELEPVEGAVAK